MDELVSRALPWTAICCVVYILGGAVYRLYFSPLAKFPGPKLAALTLWYEFYYDVVKKGRYTWKIGELHKKYGPIIRISPYEIHVNDPDFLDVLYVSGSVRRTEKYPWAVKIVGNGNSSFVTIDHDLHRLRRGAYAPFFSKASVQKQAEPVVQPIVNKLVRRLQQLRGTGVIINLNEMYASLTGDIISQYALGAPYDLLDHPDFSPHWYQAWSNVAHNVHLLNHFGWVVPLMSMMPVWMVNFINPRVGSLFRLLQSVRSRVIEVKSDLQEGRKMPERKTVLHGVLTNENVRSQEKDTTHLMFAFQGLNAGGTVTTAHMLSVLTFHVLNNPVILERLQKELGEVMTEADSAPHWVQLEKLPYFNAVITEGLRLGYGVVHRLQRVSPDVALRYKDYEIPVKTPVGMTAVLIHENPDLFPNPHEFSPDRWLEPSSAQRRKYLFTFGRGSRSCPGIYLAHCEFYLTLAAIFAPHRFNLQLFETDISDVEPRHDFVAPESRLDSKGIRVVVN